MKTLNTRFNFIVYKLNTRSNTFASSYYHLFLMWLGNGVMQIRAEVTVLSKTLLYLIFIIKIELEHNKQVLGKVFPELGDVQAELEVLFRFFY